MYDLYLYIFVLNKIQYNDKTKETRIISMPSLIIEFINCNAEILKQLWLVVALGWCFYYNINFVLTFIFSRNIYEAYTIGRIIIL